MVDEVPPAKQLKPSTIILLTLAFAILSIAFNYAFMKASRQMRSLVPNSKPLFTSTHLKSRFDSKSVP